VNHSHGLKVSSSSLEDGHHFNRVIFAAAADSAPASVCADALIQQA
jgi:hypothetical protein